MKKLKYIFIATLLLIALSGCSSWNRALTDAKSDFGGGLDRTVNILNANGDVIKTYKGRIDIESNDSGVIKFDLNGKRYMYYNCYIETVGDI